MTEGQTIRVLIVDDHPMVLEGMKSLLRDIPFVNVAGTARDAFEALSLLKSELPDLVLTDISLPEVSGIELIARIKKDFPEIKLLAMSTFRERSYISQAILNGASGYLAKSASGEEIEEAILTVHEGKLYLKIDLDTAGLSGEIAGDMPVLTRREKEVLALIAEGLTNPQIAGRLFISLHTVDSHRKNLLTKFSVNNTAALIRMAARFRMI